jgi:hypothetical protein
MAYRSRRRSERGVVMVLAAFLLVAMGAFMALSLNTGHGVAVKTELQNAADAAAIAGARELNGSFAGAAGARTFASDYASRHVTDQRIPIAGAVTLGNWDPAATPKFTPLTPNVGNLISLNAVRVRTAREGTAPGGGALPAFFGKAFLGGREQFDVSAEAIAVSAFECNFGCLTSPFVIRYGCLFSGDLKCSDPPADYVVGLSPAPVDSAGLSDLTPLPPDTNSNASSSASQTCRALVNLDETDCTEMTAGMKLQTQNGNELNTKGGCGGETLCQVIKRKYPPGTVMKVPVVTYNEDLGSDPPLCDGQYGGTGTIRSIVHLRVEGVWCNEDEGRLGPCAPYATGECIALKFLCPEDEEGPNGTCVEPGVLATAKLAG